jgi:hypothetical protein
MKETIEKTFFVRIEHGDWYLTSKSYSEGSEKTVVELIRNHLDSKTTLVFEAEIGDIKIIPYKLLKKCLITVEWEQD